MNFGDMTWTMTMAKCPCCKSHLAYSSDNNYNTWKCYSCGFTMFKQRKEQMMTREEAIEIFKHLKENAPNEMHLETVGTAQELFEMAIQALSQEPCDDAISREFIEITTHYPPSETCIYPEYKGKPYYSIKYRENEKTIVGYGTYSIEVLSRYLKEYFIPSVTHKSGKWIRWREEVQRGTHYTENIPHCKCSECDTEYDIFASRFINYCPNCGAKMVEPQESEEQTE